MVGEDESEFKLDYNPNHPDADAEGYVRMPNVEVVQEMVDMMAAYRAYEANITAINTFKDMAVKTLEIGS
jgi:flagellar basal-body rod protein FlgC